jgi:hypothetical protein
MNMRVHKKDLAADGVTIIRPSDPSFNAKFAERQQGQRRGQGQDSLMPFSVFLHNESEQTVVAYLIQWCFTKPDGTNDCYRKAFTASKALMEGEKFTPEGAAQSGKIKSNSDVYVSLLNPDGTGPFRIQLTPEEKDQYKQGARLDSMNLSQRVLAELANFTDVTISLDGLFFEDGTFVGDDTSGFFAQVKAQTDARRDLLNKLEAANGRGASARAALFSEIQTIAIQDPPAFRQGADPQNLYDYFKTLYAKEILSSKDVVGEDQAVQLALRGKSSPWRVLRKKK